MIKSNAKKKNMKTKMFRLKYRKDVLMHLSPKAICVKKIKSLIAENPSNWIEKNFSIELVY